MAEHEAQPPRPAEPAILADAPALEQLPPVPVVYTTSPDGKPEYLPARTLQGRLAALSGFASNSVSALPTLLLAPGAASGLISMGLLGLLGIEWIESLWGAAATPVFMGLLLLCGAAGGAVGGYFLGVALLGSKYRRGYDWTARFLQTTELPVLIADEHFCRSVIDTVSDQVRFMFSGPPTSRRLEDHLSLAAAYVQALQLTQFTAENPRAGVYKHGNSGYFAASPGARNINWVLSGVSCLSLPFAGCVLPVTLPFLVINLLRLAEQRGTLAAICDYFSDKPGTAAES